MMIQTLGVFNSLMLGVCAWFTWIKKPAPRKLILFFGADNGLGARSFL
jgi:hypothetical protein